MPPEGKKLRNLAMLFSSDLCDTGYTAKDLKILETFLVGKKRHLPFGTIAVNARGVVTELKIKNLLENEKPAKDWQPAKIFEDETP